ncbi:MAG: HD domain-containing protein [Bacteroidales bacterium]|nr:MAG: HD domain-containing protein [Bacteroidales bacterium]
MELLLERISNSEQKWLKPLYKHTKTLFEKTHLPSHDAEHHLRVWLHCRGLLIELHKAGIKTTHDTIDNAIVACFFHDTGLTLDMSERHGLLGRKLCEEYFNQNPKLKISDMVEVLEAIEMHDDKSKRVSTASTHYTMKTILRLVSAADDLDALGYIGVFRYLEIYLKRGIPEREIPKKVTVNLRNRFSNFLNTYSGLHKYSEKEKFRYKETYDFFTELDSLFYQDSIIEDSQLAVFKTLKECLVVKHLGINETIEETLRKSSKAYELGYFSKLRNELEVTSALLLE